MRHEKIIPADLACPPATGARIAVTTENAPAEGGKGPPVAQHHFFFCGRVPSRRPVAKRH